MKVHSVAALTITIALLIALALFVAGLGLEAGVDLPVGPESVAADLMLERGLGAAALHLGVLMLMAIAAVRTIAASVVFGREGDRRTALAGALVILMILVSLTIGILA
ncbi:MAG: hypothetical protein KY459_00870 [Acidobacteria bacterium]|nr:hypothetical protein [Acidobacteriota bacterium]